MQYLIKNDTYRPDIVFNGIDIAFECLRTHIERCSNIILLFLGHPVISLSKSKVSNLIHVILDEDIGWFEISVQEPSISEIFESFVDISEDWDGLGF